MKVLFVLRNLLYLRNYGSTLAELSNRGHEIVVAYESDRNLMPAEVEEAAGELVKRYPHISIKHAAGRSDRWTPLIQQIRWMRDYLRYCRPDLPGAARCAARAESFVFPPLRRVARLSPSRRRSLVPALDRLLQQADGALPQSKEIASFIAAERPDCILVTPMVDFGINQTEYVRVGQSMGIPTALCVASWDNLTNKGRIQVVPDRVMVWNEHQVEEAAQLHGVPRERLVVTGAQLFDHWFDRGPTLGRAEFCRNVGLDTSEPFVLYTCSSVFICRREAEVLERWLAALRASADPALRTIGVLIRPHPGSPKFAHELKQIREKLPGKIALFPERGGYPVTQAAQDDYFDSLYHAAAVVGINTSAMLEAGILGRRCLTIYDPATAESQGGMLHFSHLLRSDFLLVAPGLATHFAQLGAVVSKKDNVESLKTFVSDFLRPHGLAQPATPLLADAVEALAEERKPQQVASPAALFWRVLLAPAALYFRSVEDMRMRKRWIEMPLKELRQKQLALLLARANKYLLRKPARSVRSGVTRSARKTRKQVQRTFRAVRHRVGRAIRSQVPGPVKREKNGPNQGGSDL